MGKILSTEDVLICVVLQDPVLLLVLRLGYILLDHHLHTAFNWCHRPRLVLDEIVAVIAVHWPAAVPPLLRHRLRASLHARFKPRVPSSGDILVEGPSDPWNVTQCHAKLEFHTSRIQILNLVLLVVLNLVLNLVVAVAINIFCYVLTSSTILIKVPCTACSSRSRHTAVQYSHASSTKFS
eukprot:SAG11_NODE_737_length_7431_cov_7.438762_10_plen_181_part_00